MRLLLLLLILLFWPGLALGGLGLFRGEYRDQ
jgi:hypothetical protein